MNDLPQAPSNRQLHDAIAGAWQQQGMTYSGIQQAVRDVQALYAAALPRLSDESAGVREALQEIADTDQYPDNEDTASELREIARRALALLQTESRA